MASCLNRPQWGCAECDWTSNDAWSAKAHCDQLRHHTGHLDDMRRMREFHATRNPFGYFREPGVPVEYDRSYIDFIRNGSGILTPRQLDALKHDLQELENTKMTEQTVKVDGIVLTRTQVEKALQELNAPKPVFPVFKQGDLVKEKYPTSHGGAAVAGLVLGNGKGGWLDRETTRLYGPVPSGYVRLTDGASTYTRAESFMVKIGEIPVNRG